MLFSKLRTAAISASMALAVFGATVEEAEAVPVDNVLSLVIDVSGSINSNEYDLQMQGYANAFRDAAIQGLILDKDNGNREGKLAVNVIQFSTLASERIAFTVLDSIGAINAFADTLFSGGSALARYTAPGSTQWTNIASGVKLADEKIANWLAVAGNSAVRSVIDVSGDGEQNRKLDGSNGTAAEEAAALAGVMATACGNVDAVNTVAIETAGMNTYFEDNVVCGSNSFGLFADSFADFEGAIKDKLRFEITGTTPVIPLPATAWMLFAGLGGLAAVKRRK